MHICDCYPQEIIDWINQFPEPDECTEEQRRITQLIDTPESIALGRDLLRRLDNAATVGEANAMIDDFKALVQYAH